MAPSELHGVLVVDKPRGPTSHDVVARLRKTLGTRQVGHAGTLDPMATGVLVIALGEATKLVPYLTAADKAYETTVAFGVETDTLDAQGTEVARAPVPRELIDELASTRADAVAPTIAAALEIERARTSQVPPAFSAIKQDGRPAHERARRGELVELDPRPVGVRKIAVLHATPAPPELSVLVEVSKGYYVRSFGRDLAASLHTRGHLTALRRVRSGAFSVDEASAMDAAREELVARIVPLPLAATRALPATTLAAADVAAARHGKLLAPEAIGAQGQGPHAWLSEDGALVAIGERAPDGRGRVLRGFPPSG